MLEFDAVRVKKGGFVLTADMKLEAGLIHAVMGPSGAGKSTLLNAVAGFEEVAAGHIRWRGADITQAPPDRRPTAMLFQDGNLFPHLTLWQNAALGLRPSLRLDAEERVQVDAALARVGLEGLGARRPGAVSGGQQSRAALARLTLQDRPILLLDEPFAALGPALKAEMLDLVAALAHGAGATVLMVTHDPADARRIADRIVVVDGGAAQDPVPAAALLDDPDGALRSYLG
jgi:thiamine transport system ATP-binding protein